MKKKSPMAAMKETKSDKPKAADKKDTRPQSAMERYAQERNKSMSTSSVRPMVLELHDPHHDLHHLERAAEIKSDKKRHSAAKTIAKKKMKALHDVSKD